MSTPREEASVESLLGSLRGDVEEMRTFARRRIAARLTLSVLAQVFAPALVPSFFSNGFFRSKGFAVGLALPLGMVLGASGYAVLQDHHLATKPRELTAAIALKLPPSVPNGATLSPPPPVPIEVAAPVPAPPAVSPPLVRPHSPHAPALRDTLIPNRELSQLEKARTLLTEGQVTATLAQVRKHVISYPHSALEQERQALYVKALVAADRMIEARVRAAAFVKRFPNSPLRGSVEKAVAVDSVMVR